jgi:hypothetical protein
MTKKASRIARLAASLGNHVTFEYMKKPYSAPQAAITSQHSFDSGNRILVHAWGYHPVGEFKESSAEQGEPTAKGHDVTPTHTAAVTAVLSPAPASPTAGFPAAETGGSNSDLPAQLVQRDQMDQSRVPVTKGGDGPTKDIAESRKPPEEEIEGWTLPIQQSPEMDAFAQDIQAILAHSQTAASPGPQIPLPVVPQTSPTAVPTAPQNGVGAAKGHDIFDELYGPKAPSRFDQGPVPLSVDFASLDAALAAEDALPPTAQRPIAPEDTTPLGKQPQPPSEFGPIDGGVSERHSDSVSSEPGTARPNEDAPPTPQPSPSVAPFKVTTDVPLIRQEQGLSCHAAACASIVAWRDDAPADSSALARGTGYWEAYAAGRQAKFPEVFEVFGMETASSGPPPLGVELAKLLDTNGPLFVAGSPPGEHAVVVAGITHDGTEAGTYASVVDPWSVGMTSFSEPNTGGTYTIPLAELALGLGAGDDHHLLIAHLRKGSL